MTTSITKRGRPSSAQSLSREHVINSALTLLQTGGMHAFSIRALARHLGITPMSVLYHVTDLTTLQQLLVERVHGAPLEITDTATPQQRVIALLHAYMQRVRTHPALTLCIFSSPDLFTHSLASFTQQLEHEIRQFDAEPILLRDMLVDYTNGYALSVALSPADTHISEHHFHAALKRLLATAHTPT
ncbi:TetR/AcrR family transcriptional regulator [Paenalcaligenes sp. Me131]|uniref:TetR/AcrR family transcriptional regulator n=1 Tax=Paenalcaligenes sp. Me131 TaxID=3392636 RepID=UPI003D2A83DC